MSEYIEETEVWKVYKDKREKNNNKQKDIWEVSNFGRVRQNGEPYEPGLHKGYFVFGPGGRWPMSVHKAVAELFIPNPDPEHKTEIDHIDRNTLNNHYRNLRWVTHRENMQNIDKEAFKKHLSESVKGEKNGFYGKKHTIETKQKMSDSIKKWWEKRKREAQ